jgi:hypothetical protein
MTNDEGMTKINSRKLSESNDVKVCSTNAASFRDSSFGLVLTFDIRASSLALKRLPKHGSFWARGVSSEPWRMHHQHRDHASEKHE